MNNGIKTLLLTFTLKQDMPKHKQLVEIKKAIKGTRIYNSRDSLSLYWLKKTMTV
jgi:hypothetical protein